MSRQEKEKQLKEIALKVGQCRKCPLWQTPEPVPGEGDPEAEILFIGEAPGYHESVQGRPFVGASGQLLTKLLKFIGLDRDKVFICNMLRHRPPNNRDPLPEEMKACRPFLDAQLQIIDPKIIVTLGRFAMSKFLPDEKISQIHGQTRYADFAGKRRIILPMYHPAAALRSGRVLDEVKQDFLRMKQLLEMLQTVKVNEEEVEGPVMEPQMKLIN